MSNVQCSLSNVQPSLSDALIDHLVGGKTGLIGPIAAVSSSFLRDGVYQGPCRSWGRFRSNISPTPLVLTTPVHLVYVVR
eukprot:4768221-Amphidinium_carterae.1